MTQMQLMKCQTPRPAAIGWSRLVPTLRLPQKISFPIKMCMSCWEDFDVPFLPRNGRFVSFGMGGMSRWENFDVPPCYGYIPAVIDYSSKMLLHRTELNMPGPIDLYPSRGNEQIYKLVQTFDMEVDRLVHPVLF